MMAYKVLYRSVALIFLLVLLSFSPKHPFFSKNKKEEFVCDIIEINNFAKNHGFFSKHPLVGKVSGNKKDIELTKQLLKVVHEKIKNPKRRLIVTAEILTKVLAYRDLKKNDVIQIPITDKYDNALFIEYRVDKVFNLWKKMPAFGLIPVSNSNQNKALAILLFRGTDSSLTTKRSWASLISDIDFGGPGLHTFFHAKEKIHGWLEKTYTQTNKKIRVMGYSLGGIFASYTILFEHNFISLNPFQPSITFNSPGVFRKIYKQWGALEKEKKPPYLVFITKNDLVSKYGKLIGEVHQFKLGKKCSAFQAHIKLISAEKKCLLKH